jgi:hypothetical protein
VTLAALATPLWFYSVQFWEHVPAVCACLWALSAGLAYTETRRPQHLILCAALAALGIYFRDELYVFQPVILGAIVLNRHSPTPTPPHSHTAIRAIPIYATALAALLVPLWLVNWRFTGSITGFHLGEHAATSQGVAGHLADRWGVFYRMLLGMHSEQWVSLLLAAPLLVLMAWRPALTRERFATAVPLVAAAALLGFGITAFDHFTHGRLWHLLQAQSLFVAAPVLVLAFLRLDDETSGWRTLRGIVLAYAALYCMVAPLTGTSGVHWANRFLLVLYPVLALLSAHTLGRWWEVTAPRWDLRKLAVMGSVAATILAQLYSVTLLARAQEFSARFNRDVAAYSERVIVTDSWFVPQQLHRVFPEKQIFLVHKGADGQALMQRLAASGVRDLLLIESVAQHPERPADAGKIVRANGLGLYDARILQVGLKPR